jgi:hypothetical protein
MKSLYTLIALLGLVSMLVGCAKQDGGAPPVDTNAPAAPSTNAPAAK